MINKSKFDLQDQKEKLKWIDWSKGMPIDVLVTCVFCNHQYLAIKIEPGEFDDCPNCHKGITDWSEETKLAVSQIVLQHLFSLEPSYSNLEHIINPEYDDDNFKKYVNMYKHFKKQVDDIRVNLNVFIPLVPEELYYQLTEIEVLITQADELLDDMVSFIKNTENIMEITQNTIEKLLKSVKNLKSAVGF